MEKNHKYVPGKKIITASGKKKRKKKKTFLSAQFINI